MITSIKSYMQRLPETTFCACSWFKDGKMQVYLRFAKRLCPFAKKDHSAIIRTIEVASVEVFQHLRGRGLYTKFLDDLEKLARDSHRRVFVENVTPTEFQEFYRKRGYIEDLNTSYLPCYWQPSAASEK